MMNFIACRYQTLYCNYHEGNQQKIYALLKQEKANKNLIVNLQPTLS
jgi:hypothetical protein